jgi:hypothetical protein
LAIVAVSSPSLIRLLCSFAAAFNALRSYIFSWAIKKH